MRGRERGGGCDEDTLTRQLFHERGYGWALDGRCPSEGLTGLLHQPAGWRSLASGRHLGGQVAVGVPCEVTRLLA